MPRVTFIYPCVGRFPATRYVRSWQMQPLSIGVLSALTPEGWDKRFYDDRLEQIDFDAPTDLAAISIETYTARRGYQIASEFRKRGVPVAVGGYHATFCPDEALRFADAVCVGQAEGVWPRMLDDTARGGLSGVYQGGRDPSPAPATPDRTIFRGKRYFDIALVESSRGCPFRCRFCAITSFYRARYCRRPISDIVDEISRLGKEWIFFVDDNIAGDFRTAYPFFRALKPLGIQWISQAGVNVAERPDLLDLMAESGCRGLLIGFESTDPASLRRMGKACNRVADYTAALDAIRHRGILVYGTFIIGNPGDGPRTVNDAVRFARQSRMALGAFNHLVPFPGTPFYESCKREGRLGSDAWWLDENFRFGRMPFRSNGVAPRRIEKLCHQARSRFYSWPSILYRGLDLGANCRSWRNARLYFGINYLLKREIMQKRGLPLGVRDRDE